MTDTLSPPRVYDKAGSILQLQAGADMRRRATERLRAWAAVRVVDPDPAREAIIRAALNDVIRAASDDIVRAASGDVIRAASGDVIRAASGDAPAPRFFLRPHTAAEIDRLREDEFARYLYYRYRYDVYPAAEIVDDYPPCVQIEPTSVCNYRCVFCYQIDPVFSSRDSGVPGGMPLDRFRRIVDRLAGKVEAVTLASRGEPLLARDLPAMLECLAGRFLAAKLNTNASRLDEKLCHALLSAGLQTLVISADAAEPAHYARLRVNGSLDRVLRNVARLHDIRHRHYPDSRMIVRVSGVKVGDDQDLDAMQALWGGLADQVAFVDFNPWTDAYGAAANGVVRPCSDLWRRLFVWWDGAVNPCDVDFRSTLTVGHIDREDIAAVWRGAAYEELRRRHRAGERQELRPCAGCTVV